MGKDLLGLLNNYNAKTEKQIIENIINLKLEDYDLTTEGHTFDILLKNMFEKMYSLRKNKLYSMFKRKYYKYKNSLGLLLSDRGICPENSIWCDQNRTGIRKKRRIVIEILQIIKKLKKITDDFKKEMHNVLENIKLQIGKLNEKGALDSKTVSEKLKELSECVNEYNTNFNSEIPGQIKITKAPSYTLPKELKENIKKMMGNENIQEWQMHLSNYRTYMASNDTDGESVQRKEESPFLAYKEGIELVDILNCNLSGIYVKIREL